MEKTGFKDPARSKVKEKEQRSPWSFEQPPYDERSSCYVNAGSHYGVGHRQPVGNTGGPKKNVDVLPYGRSKTLRDDEIPKKNLRLEIDM